MRRCNHSVYIPEWHPGDDSPYCSVCCVPEPTPGGLPTSKFFPFPYNKSGCPKCGAKKGFHWVNEWDWNCKKCGASWEDDEWH